MGGYTIKIVQGGQAASTGIMAAGLASRGITGFPEVLEGSALNGGFCQITTGSRPNLEKITENLGKPYSIMDVYFKPFTACRHYPRVGPGSFRDDAGAAHYNSKLRRLRSSPMVLRPWR